MTTTMTLSDINEFDQYCKDNQISKSEGFDRLNISEYSYYKSRRINSSPLSKKALAKRSSTKSQSTINKEISLKSSPQTKPGRFIPLETPLPSSQYSPSTSRAYSQHNKQSAETNLTIDINMGNGKEIRISGEVTINILHEILISLSNSTPHV